MTTVLVAVAGAIGAAIRYRIGLAVGVRPFPWPTLGINISGCSVLALVLAGPGDISLVIGDDDRRRGWSPGDVHHVLDLRVRAPHVAANGAYGSRWRLRRAVVRRRACRHALGYAAGRAVA